MCRLFLLVPLGFRAFVRRVGNGWRLSGLDGGSHEVSNPLKPIWLNIGLGRSQFLCGEMYGCG